MFDQDTFLDKQLKNQIFYIFNKLIRYNYLGLTDDDVFIKECNIECILPELKDSQVNAISLKSGLNITHHYPDIKVPLPNNFIQKEPYLKWNWRTQPRPTDWGYPTCINTYVYNKEYQLSLLERINFTHPTEIEIQCNCIKEHFRPVMCGVTKTAVLNLPCNRLQPYNDTPFGVVNPYTTDELNEKWLEGFVIDKGNIYNKEVDRPNIDLPLTFIKESL